MNDNAKIYTITTCWIMVGIFITVYDDLIMKASFSIGPAADYSFGVNLLLNATVGFAAAITGGVFLVKYVNNRFSNVAYWKSIVLVVGSFIVVSFSLIAIVSILQAAVRTGGEISWSVFEMCLADPMHMKNLLIWSVVVAATQLMLQVDNKFGEGVLYSLMSGKYYRPREEKRIFMIVDLNASTTMAELLPQDQYHLLLRDFFIDITRPILINRGQIYHYVGDGLVVSWGVSENSSDNHCLQCYFDMQEIISRQKDRYIMKYGFAPHFKAGLHYGNVIAGEIGVIKKDITYSGDVLNTVSRIQGKCHDFSVNILTSDELLSLLPYEKKFRRIPLGEVELRGKQRKVWVSSLALADNK